TFARQCLRSSILLGTGNEAVLPVLLRGVPECLLLFSREFLEAALRAGCELLHLLEALKKLRIGLLQCDLRIDLNKSSQIDASEEEICQLLLDLRRVAGLNSAP